MMIIVVVVMAMMMTMVMMDEPHCPWVIYNNDLFGAIQCSIVHCMQARWKVIYSSWCCVAVL